MPFSKVYSILSLKSLLNFKNGAFLKKYFDFFLNTLIKSGMDKFSFINTKQKHFIIFNNNILLYFNLVKNTK